MDENEISIGRVVKGAWQPVGRLAGLKGRVTELEGKGLARAALYAAGATHSIELPSTAGIVAGLMDRVGELTLEILTVHQDHGAGPVTELFCVVGLAS